MIYLTVEADHKAKSVINSFVPTLTSFFLVECFQSSWFRCSRFVIFSPFATIMCSQKPLPNMPPSCACFNAYYRSFTCQGLITTTIELYLNTSQDVIMKWRKIICGLQNQIAKTFGRRYQSDWLFYLCTLCYWMSRLGATYVYQHSVRLRDRSV